MSIGVPVRLANGIGNLPDASKWMDNYDYLSAIISGQFVKNAGMEFWTAATSFTNPAHAASVADSWTVLKTGTLGATVDVSREASILDSGTYSMKLNITGAGSANSIWDIHQAIGNYSQFASETVLLGVKVRASTANKVRCKVYDGVTSAVSTYHTGNSSFQLLTALLPVAAVPTELTVTLEVNPSDFTGAVYIDSVFLYVVPAQISTTARAALSYSPLNAGFLPLTGGTLTGSLIAAAISSTGLTMSGNIVMASNKLTGLAAGSGNGDSLRYEQLVGAYLPLGGGTMSGAIAMGGQKITGIGLLESGGFRSTSNTTSGGAAGPAVEILYQSGSGIVEAFDRTTALFIPLIITSLGMSIRYVGTDKIVISSTNVDVYGTTTNNSAGAGIVGEYVESLSSAASNAPGDVTFDDLVSISLTAGDWDIWAMALYESNGATWNRYEIGISTTSGNSSSGLTQGQNWINTIIASSSTAVTSIGNFIVPFRVSIASTTTYYLKRRFGYSAGTPRTAGGRLAARRCR